MQRGEAGDSSIGEDQPAEAAIKKPLLPGGLDKLSHELLPAIMIEQRSSGSRNVTIRSLVNHGNGRAMLAISMYSLSLNGRSAEYRRMLIKMSTLT